MILSNEWERESAILMILGVHATKFLLCTPKTPIDNGFHSLSRFRHFITEWIDSRSQTRVHSNTKRQYYKAQTIGFKYRFEFSILYSRFLRCESKIWKYRIHRYFSSRLISFSKFFFLYMWNSIRELYIFFHRDLYILSFLLSVTFFLEESQVIKRYK